jgi:hypothetical protein
VGFCEGGNETSCSILYNDFDLNGFSLIFQDIKNYIMNITHSNILLMNIPFRYDLPDASFVNKTISVMNTNLVILVKAFPHTKFLETLNNRQLFTTHGLHRNKLGKRLVNLQLAQLLLTTSRRKELRSIPLGGCATCNERTCLAMIIK